MTPKIGIKYYKNMTNSFSKKFLFVINQILINLYSFFLNFQSNLPFTVKPDVKMILTSGT